MSKKYYKLAPVSKQVFTMLETDSNSDPLPGAPPAQNIDVSKLNEAGLHKVLFILRNKIDPKEMGTAFEAWIALPSITSSPLTKPDKLDPDIHKNYTVDKLRMLIEQFLEKWYKESLEKRTLPLSKMKDKFEKIPGWPTLHTVKPMAVANSQLVLTPAGGVEVQPEQCATKLRDLRARIQTLSDAVAECKNQYSCATQAGCEKRVSCIADTITEIQKSEEVLCTTSL